MYNEDIEYPEKGPAVTIEWWDGFGTRIKMEYDLLDETVYSLGAAMKSALLGFGFHPRNVDGIFAEEI